jgi:hypothetical protein
MKRMKKISRRGAENAEEERAGVWLHPKDAAACR